MSQRQRARACPRLELLEDRLTPASYVVNSVLSSETGSGSAGTLAYCIAQANSNPGADRITFDPSVFGQGASQAAGISLTAQLPAVTEDLEIEGLSGMRLFVERSTDPEVPTFRLFDVTGSAQLTLIALSLRGGEADTGSAVLVNSGCRLILNGCTVEDNTATGPNTGGAVASFMGDVTISDSLFRNNRSTNPDQGHAGALFSYHSELAVVRSTFAGNTAQGLGGAVLIEGGAQESTFVNCTFSGNTAAYGGGLCLLSNALTPIVSLSHCTFADNSASVQGGGAFNYLQLGTGSVIEYENCIFTANTSSNLDTLPGGTLLSLGHNLSSDGTGNLNQTGDRPNTDPRLGPLADNGGPVPTHALLPDSPAIDAGGGALVTQDARGVPRPQGNAADIGAFEMNLLTLVNTAGNGQAAVVAQEFGQPLQVRLFEGRRPWAGVSITFTALAGTATASFAGGARSVTVTTDANGFASSPLLTAGSVAGSVVVTARVGEASASFTLFSLPDVVAGYQIDQVGAIASGQPFALTVIPVDRFGNRRPSGLGVVRFSSTDPRAELPGDFDFTAQGEEVGEVFVIPGFRLNTAGQQSITLTELDEASLSASVDVVVSNRAPQVFVGPDQFTHVDELFTREGFFVDDGGGPVSVSVDYGDGTPVQRLSVDAGGRFTLSHTYRIEGSFTVTVIVNDGQGGIGTGQFRADVMLPGVEVVNKGLVPGGTVITVRVPGATATLAHHGPGTAELIVAVVPTTVAGGLDPAFFADTEEVAAAYDVRAIDVSAGDVLIVTFRYQSDDTSLPTLTFFHRETNRQVVIDPSLYTVDPIRKEIRLVLTSQTMPSLLSLDGTVFTISIPASVDVPSTPSVPDPIPVTSLTNTTTQTTASAGTTSSASGSATSPMGSSSGLVNIVLTGDGQSSLAAGTGGELWQEGNNVDTEEFAGPVARDESLLGPLPEAPRTLMSFPTLTVSPSRAVPSVFEDPPSESQPPEKEQEEEYQPQRTQRTQREEGEEERIEEEGSTPPGADLFWVSLFSVFSVSSVVNTLLPVSRRVPACSGSTSTTPGSDSNWNTRRGRSSSAGGPDGTTCRGA